MLDQETKRRIDSSRDILVGKVPDPKAQVDQITTAMIYKFMDDMDEEAKSFEGGRAKFFTGDYKKYKWSFLLDRALSGEDRCELYINAINSFPKNEKLPQLFRDIFKNAFLPYRNPETLNLFLKEIDGFSYDNSENLGNAFEYLLSILGSQGDAGQFRTPRHIIDFIVEVLDPQKGESICDPACGTSGFLISAYKHIIKNNSKNYNPKNPEYSFDRDEKEALSIQIQSNGKYKGEKLTPNDKRKLQKALTGYDISPDMVKLSKVNLYLHKFQNPQIHEYDTLTSDTRWDDDFDIVLANPPFMTPKGGIRPHGKFSIEANRSEVLFVDYIAEHLSINGRAGIIVPEGVIFKTDNAYKNLRETLLEDNYLWAVMSLPAKVFEPYSGVKTSILFLDKKRAKKTDEILFIDAQNDGFELGATRRQIEQNDLPKAFRVLKAWINKEKTRSEMAFWVKKKKIEAEGSWSFSGNLYRPKKKIVTKWPMVELGEILDYEQPTKYIVKSSNYSDNYETPVLTAGKTFLLGHTKEKTGIFPLDKLPVIIFDDFTTANKFVTFSFKVKSSAIKILKSKNNNVLSFVFYIMKKINFNSSVHKRYWISTYSKIKIPLPPLSIQKEIVAEIEIYQKIIDGAKQIVENWKPTIKINPKWSMVKLGDVCEIYQPKTISQKEMVTDGKYIVFGANGPIGRYNQYNHEHSEVLITCRGATCGTINLSDKKSWITGNAMVVKPNKNSKLNKFFLFYILAKVNLSKIISGSAQPQITRQNLSPTQIPLPPLSIQKEIVAEIEKEKSYIDSCKKLIELNEEKIKNKIDEVWNQK